MVERQRIIAGSQELFKNASIKSVTMDEIAHHLGVSKKTIYTHFKNKEELVMALVTDNIEDYKKKISSILKNPGKVFFKLFELSNCVTAIFSGINPIQRNDLCRYFPDIWSLFKKFKEEVLTDAFASILQKGKDDGLVRSELRINILVQMRVDQIQQGFDKWVFPSNSFNDSEVQEELTNLFLYGIATPKGIKELQGLPQLILPIIQHNNGSIK
jgi:AcrR family transcriptional regulator